MIDDLRALAIFAETVKQGSFRAAAKSLELSPSVVSYQISRLESSLGTTLLYRSTRNLSLSSEGETLYQRAKEMLLAASTGLEEISANTEYLTGKVSVSLPTAFIQHPITQSIVHFKKQHSRLNLKLFYDDSRSDLISEGIDLAIRVGDMPDSSLRARRIGMLKRKLVCSKEYYNAQVKPESIEDIAHWDWIKLAPLPAQRMVVDTQGNEFLIQFNSTTEVNSVEAMYQLCVQGLGVATPPANRVEQKLKSGELVELLPSWTVAPIPLYAVWPEKADRNTNLAKLLEYLLPTPTSSG